LKNNFTTVAKLLEQAEEQKFTKNARDLLNKYKLQDNLNTHSLIPLDFLTQNSSLHSTIQKKLIKAARKGDYHTAFVLFNFKISPNFISEADRLTPLSLAAHSGSLKLVQLLLEHGANPNLQLKTKNKDKDQNGYTALHALCRNRHIPEPEQYAIATLLLEHGADPNILGIDLHTTKNPLPKIASNITKNEKVKVLLKEHETIEFRNAKFNKSIYKTTFEVLEQLLTVAKKSFDENAITNESDHDFYQEINKLQSKIINLSSSSTHRRIDHIMDALFNNTNKLPSEICSHISNFIDHNESIKILKPLIANVVFSILKNGGSIQKNKQKPFAILHYKQDSIDIDGPIYCALLFFHLNKLKNTTSQLIYPKVISPKEKKERCLLQ
jgi:ankyrin repeat protein